MYAKARLRPEAAIGIVLAAAGMTEEIDQAALIPTIQSDDPFDQPAFAMPVGIGSTGWNVALR